MVASETTILSRERKNMKKRVTDLPVGKMTSRRGSFLRSPLCLRTLLTCAVAVLALGGGPTSAYGGMGESLDTEGAFQTGCADLRTAVNFSRGDEIFVCDSVGEQCHLFSTTDEGVGTGFCKDKVLDIVPDRGGVLESNVSIVGTTFATDIGVVDSTGAGGDVFCETFGTPSPGTKVCVNIFSSSDNSVDCTENCGTIGIIVQRDSCTAVKAVL